MCMVECVAFAPDGRTLAAAARPWSGDGRETGDFVILYDAVTLRERSRFRATEDRGRSHIHVRALAYAPDDRALATGFYGGGTIWDVATRRERVALESPTHGVRALAFSPDGATLAGSFSQTDPRLFDAATGRERAILQGHDADQSGVTKSIPAVAFAPDGKTLVTAGVDHTLRFWDMATGRLQRTLVGPSNFCSVTFAPDGRTVAAGTADSEIGVRDEGVRLYDAATGRETAVLPCPNRWVSGVAFTPDGRSLVSLNHYGPVRLWDVATSQQRAVYGPKMWYPRRLALSPDGKTVALGGHIGYGEYGSITLLEIAGDGFHLRKPAP